MRQSQHSSTSLSQKVSEGVQSKLDREQKNLMEELEERVLSVDDRVLEAQDVYSKRFS